MAQAAELIIVPFDSALHDARMGRGPHALLEAGLLETLREVGVRSTTTEVGPENSFQAEIATAFDLHRQVRTRVRAARTSGLPITLSGNCNCGVVGSLAAHDSEDVGLFWFDAHSDAETPETSSTGFLDGMGLAIVLGCCFRPLLASLPWGGLRGVRGALIGAREISAAAGELLAREGVTIVSPGEAKTLPPSEALSPAVARMRSAGVTRVHVHVDLDVLDPVLVGPANGYALEGGFTLTQLEKLLETILDEFDLASASIASYDPAYDEHGAVAAAGLEVVQLLAKRARAP